MTQPEFGQWAEETERILDSSLSNDTQGFVNLDTEVMNHIAHRCIKRFGKSIGI
jgi:hypothetical protein